MAFRGRESKSAGDIQNAIHYLELSFDVRGFEERRSTRVALCRSLGAAPCPFRSNIAIAALATGSPSTSNALSHGDQLPRPKCAPYPKANGPDTGSGKTNVALYLKQLAEKTRRGLRGRVEAGRSGGGNSYGYDVVSGVKTDGTPDVGGRRINESEAAVVRRIYKLYADGMSPRRIAKALNGEGIRGPHGAAWGPSTINGNATRGTGILNNELYIGRLVWNRLRYVKDPSTGRRRSKLNPTSAHIVRDVPHLRVVRQELWDAVKARQDQISREPRPDRKQV